MASNTVVLAITTDCIRSLSVVIALDMAVEDISDGIIHMTTGITFLTCDIAWYVLKDFFNHSIFHISSTSSRHRPTCLDCGANTHIISIRNKFGHYENKHQAIVNACTKIAAILRRNRSCVKLTGYNPFVNTENMFHVSGSSILKFQIFFQVFSHSLKFVPAFCQKIPF